MSYMKILRYALLVGLSFVFFIPFILADGGQAFGQGTFLYIPFPSTFFPFIVGKNFVFRIVIEVLFALYILLALREPKYRPKSSLIMWVVGAFIAWMGLSTVFSVDPVKSFWSNFERMEGYVTLLHLGVFFVMAGAMLSVEDWWNRFLKVSIAASMVMGVYAMFQLMHVHGFAISSQSGLRVDTTFGNAIYLAVYMLFNIFITLLVLIRERRSMTAQVVYGIALVLQMMSLYFTQTRGAFLGMILGLLITAIFIAVRAREREWQSLRTLSLVGIGAIVVIVLFVFTVKDTSFVKNSPTLSRMTSISLNEGTIRARFKYIWPMALKGSIDSPKTMAVGWGQENFSYVFNRYYMPGMYGQEQWFDRAHNQFLDWLVAGGLPAFLLYLSLFGLMVWVIVSSEVLSVPEQAVLLGLVAGYMFNNLSVFDDLMSSIYFFVLLALVHTLSKRPVHTWMFLSKPVGNEGVAIAAPIVLVAMVLGVWALNAPGLARAENLVSAIMQQVAVPDGHGGVTGAQKDPKTYVSQFKVALGEGEWPGTALGRQEATEQLIQYAWSTASKNIDPSLKQDVFTLAENAGKSINVERPHDARLELFMGTFYDAYGQYAKGLEYLNRALADSPAKQQIMFEVGLANINSGAPQTAVPIFKKAFESEPKYTDARIFYAASLFYSGDKVAADKVLIDGFGTVLVDDQRLIQVYTTTKQTDRVVGIWQARIAADPKNAQLHVGLASFYFSIADIANTIVQLRIAAQTDPALSGQAEQIIKQIQDGTLKPNH